MFLKVKPKRAEQFKKDRKKLKKDFFFFFSKKSTTGCMFPIHFRSHLAKYPSSTYAWFSDIAEGLWQRTDLCMRQQGK